MNKFLFSCQDTVYGQINIKTCDRGVANELHCLNIIQKDAINELS